MEYRPFIYGLKVWVSSVLIAPFVTTVLQCCADRSISNAISCLGLYPLIVVFELAFSFMTWLVFWFVIEMTARLTAKSQLIKLIASLTGALLTPATFRLLGPFDSFSLSDIIFALMVSNCLCIVCGCWVFNPVPKIKPYSCLHWIKRLFRNRKRFNVPLLFILILCNMTFITWIIYNGIHDMFATSTGHLFCSVALVGVLGINIIMLQEKKLQR